MRLRFYKTDEFNASSYEKNPVRSNAILNLENNYKFYFIPSLLAHLRPCEKTQPTIERIDRKNFNELNFHGFDSTNGFECSDVHIFENLINLSINMFEINFYLDQDQKNVNMI